MKYFLIGFLAIFSLNLTAQESHEKLLKELDRLLDVDLDSAYIIGRQLLESATSDSDLFYEVQANFYLAYITKQKQEITASVFYHLEAIRKADLADYEGVKNDKIKLRRNIANIFRNFRVNDLATEYSLEAIELAEEINNTQQVISLKLNQALVYQDEEQYELALQLFREILPFVEDDYLFRITNQIGIVYFDQKKFDLARQEFLKVVEICPETHSLHAKALHNLGEIAYESGDINQSIEKLYMAIELFENHKSPDHYGLFNSYRNLGRYLTEVKEYTKAEIYITKALAFQQHANEDPESFEIFKIASDFYYDIGDKDQGAYFLNRYYDISQEYIAQQQEIQKGDKEYNFQLITKRYFDQVEEQERVASIMFYSKLSSGGLILLLILVVIYYQVEKLRTRRNLEKELRALRILE